MTIIQPNKNKSIINKVLFSLAIPLVLSVIWLVALFNQTVSLQHETLKLNTSLQEVQAENAAMKDQVLKLFNGRDVEKLARDRGLLQDKNPEYLVLNGRNQQWELASQ